MKDEKIAMIGTGMMGMSLAVLFTGNGYDTTVLATKEASVLRGRNSYNEMYSVLQERGLVSETQDGPLCRKSAFHFGLPGSGRLHGIL